MAEVSIEVAGRNYPVTCRDGDEDHVRTIARLVDAKARDAQRSVGGINETRNLLLAALLLADELSDARAGDPAASPAPAPAGSDIAPVLDRLAERVESVASWLEQGAARP